MHSLLADPNSDYVNANYIDVSSFVSPFFYFLHRPFPSLIPSLLLLVSFFRLKIFAVEELHTFLFEFCYSDAQEVWLWHTFTYLSSVIYDGSNSLLFIPPEWYPQELVKYFSVFVSLPGKSSACGCEPSWVLLHYALPISHSCLARERKKCIQDTKNNASILCVFYCCYCYQMSVKWHKPLVTVLTTSECVPKQTSGLMFVSG